MALFLSFYCQVCTATRDPLGVITPPLGPSQGQPLAPPPVQPPGGVDQAALAPQPGAPNAGASAASVLAAPAQPAAPPPCAHIWVIIPPASSAAPAVTAAEAAVPPPPPVLHRDPGEWSTSALRPPPPPFTLLEIASAMRLCRRPNQAEAAADAAKPSISALLIDPYVEAAFSTHNQSFPKDSFDSIPKRLSAAAARRVAIVIPLLLSLASSLASPENLAARNAMTAMRVVVSARLPDVEIQPLAAVGVFQPSGAELLDTITALMMEADGHLLEASHFADALRAANHSGAVVLEGTQADLKAVRVAPAFSRMYETRLSADETSEPVVVFRALGSTLLVNTPARLSCLYRTPPDFVLRKRLLQSHWRHYWHSFVRFCDDKAKDQLTLQNQYNAFRDRQDQLGVLQAAVGSPAPRDAPAAVQGSSGLQQPWLSPLTAGKEGRQAAPLGSFPARFFSLSLAA